MIVKLKEEEDHLVNLRRIFNRLRKYQLKLNPSKCLFVITSGNLLVVIASRRESEIDSAKIRSIRDVPASHTEREMSA